MIVRIQGEGQFRLPDDTLTELNDLDAAVEAALDDAEAFPAALAALLDRVREVGIPIADDELTGSDIILPASDSTPDEVAAMLTEEGLLPG
jgi:hypothetical protein